MASIEDGKHVKRGRGRPKKQEKQMEGEQKLNELDQPIAGLKFDIEELEEWTENNIQGMLNDREEWAESRKKYMPEFENLLRDNRADGPWEGSANFHVPLTMWMMKQFHARVYSALIGDGFGFTTIAQEKMDIERAMEVDRTMRWAINSYANEWDGIKLIIDDWIWDVIKEGWGFLKCGWDKKQQKIALTEEELNKFNSRDNVQQVLTSMMQIVTKWEGPKIVTIDHENILFPGKAKNSSDVNEFPIVAEYMEFSKEDIGSRINNGLWLREPSEMLLKSGDSSNITTGNRQIDDAQRIKDAAMRVKTQRSDAPALKNAFGIYEVNARVDVDNDSIEEDLVYWYAPSIRKIVRITTLDRLNVSMKRNLHKVDFIRRPRRTFGIGLPEMLYSVNKEIDAMHNQRIDFGTLASIPTFFFRPLSGLKGERIRLTPGEGIPLNNPQSDVYIPNFNTNVTFTRQEEAMLVGYAERMAALPAMTAGQTQSPAGATSTATGITTLLAQTGFDFDVVLGRFKSGYESLLKNIHSLMMVRMPEGMKFRVLGAGNTEVLDDDGMPIYMEGMTRQKLCGDFDFKIRANDRALNREVEKQDALVLANILFNPILLQSGIVQPNNLYHITQNILTKRGEIEMDKFITKPENVETPLSIVNEIVVLMQGQMPRIIMNDDHVTKIKQLNEYYNSDEFARDIKSGVVDYSVAELFKKAIGVHEKWMNSVNAQANQANVTGQQVGTTLGSRMTGEVNQQTGRSFSDEEIIQAESASQPQMTAGGLEIPSF